jgi:hypothetical protein
MSARWSDEPRYWLGSIQRLLVSIQIYSRLTCRSTGAQGQYGIT